MGYVVQGQHYTTVLPTDIPSPATTVNDYQADCMLGWTAAQGRSSALGSPITPVRGSVSSQGQAQPILQSSSPPAPRETILDRAFQLRVIPGSDRETPGEEKLTSLAKFEALMREVENRQRQARQDSITSPMTSTWEEDESDEDEDTNDELEDDDTDEDGFEEDLSTDRARRALMYGANRHSSVSQSGRTSLSSHSEGRPFNQATAILRPHTAHSKVRPPVAQRTASEPQFGVPLLDAQPLALRTREDSIVRNQEKRLSASSVQRLSFTDYTKRLSSSSSLLLVQSNVTNGSSQGNSEVGTPPAPTQSTLLPREMPRAHREMDRDEHCGWRGSVGVFGGEGGFV